MKNSGQLLGWLETNNMYIQKFDVQPTKYRFHSLFRNELEAHLKKIRTSEEINALYLKTARYYEKQGNAESAIRFFIAAGSTVNAVNRNNRVYVVRHYDIFIYGTVCNRFKDGQATWIAKNEIFS